MTTPKIATARVISLAGDLSGGYCARLLADCGAQVVRVEDPSGDPLRTWSHTGPARGDGALFQFLAAGSASVVVSEPAELTGTFEAADVILWSPHSAIARELPPGQLRTLNPNAVITAITDFGLEGPWVGRPATELTLQAMSGGQGQRGAPERPPLMAGGRLGEWVAGMFAAVHTAAALYGGSAELLDVSVLESLILATTAHPVSWYTIAGTPMRPIRARNLPDIHATKDGYIGFMVVTGQQYGVNTHASIPVRWSSIPGHRLAGPALMLGEHDDTVWLGQIGLSEAEYQSLREAGAIGRSAAKAFAW